jgi:putative cell wall-binding protein
VRRFSSVASVVVLTVGLLAAPAFAAPALADSIPPRDPAPAAPDPGGAPESPPAAMGDYSAESFSAEAQTLDPGLLDAVTNDLGISGEQYLADGAAAVDASYVVEDLEESGHELLGSRMDGTQLTVYVDSDDTAAAASAAGANVVHGAPDRPDVDTTGFQPLSDLYGGQGWYYQDSTFGYQCSVGFNGYDTSTSAAQFVTAGHCVPAGTNIVGQISSLNLAHPGDKITSGNLGPALGLPVPGSFHFGDDLDSGLVNISQPGWTMKPQVLNWGGGKGGPLQSPPVSITDTRPAIVGASLCRSGSRSGWSCGTILDTDVAVDVQGHEVNEILATTCADHGDSGGAAITGTAAVGLTSAGPDLLCSDPRYASAYYPMISPGGWGSVQSQHPAWEPIVTVAAPVVTAPTNGGSIRQGGLLTGTVPNGNATNLVTITIAADPSSPHTVTVGADGQWKLPLSSVPLGSHGYTAKASWKTRSSSSTASGSFTVVADPAVARLSGTDRYATSVAIAAAAYPDHADVVYVATGENYPDALSAAPAAVKQGAPLLLIPPTGLLPEISAEISSLSPDHIVVVGGPDAITDASYSQLSALTPDIVRISGTDRYDTSRKVTARAFPGSVQTAYLATGLNFPDALSASAVAAGRGEPVILVVGSDPSVDAATTSFIQGKGITSLVIAGGETVVSPQLAAQLDALPGMSVSRLSGATRLETSGTINRASFTTSTDAYLATANSFPDALAGSALAGLKHAPLYVVPSNCIPSYDAQDIATFGVTRVTLLGGPDALDTGVQSLTVCG